MGLRILSVIDFGIFIVWFGFIGLFLGLVGLCFWGLVKGRAWWWKAGLGLVVVTPILVLWTHHVRRFVFSEQLTTAVDKGDLRRARELLSWGANPNLETEFGTALEAAKKSGNREMIRLLEAESKR